MHSPTWPWLEKQGSLLVPPGSSQEGQASGPLKTQSPRPAPALYYSMGAPQARSPRCGRLAAVRGAVPPHSGQAGRGESLLSGQKEFSRSLCYWPGFLASLANGNWPEARQERQARFYWGSSCSRGWGRVRRICRSPCSLAPRGLGGTRSLYGVRVEACPEVGQRCGLGGGVCTQLLLTSPFFCSRLFKSCSWVFFFFNLFAAFVQNLSPLTVHMVHFRPII